MKAGYEELEKLLEDERLKDEIALHLIDHWKYLNIRKYYGKDDAIKFFLNDERGKVNFVSRVEEKTFQLKGKRVLDVGCGKGAVVISCALRGANIVGFDVDEDEIRIARLRVKSYSIDNALVFKGDAENIPFPDNSFDLVTATAVLEHVKNLEKVIKEIARVLRVGGFACITCPNPLFPREGHYKVFWIPYLPKRLGEIYLRIRGFNPDFFMKGVRYPYPSLTKIETILRKNGMNVENITEKDILTKFKAPALIKTRRIKKLVKCLKELRVNNLIANLIAHFHFYPGAFVIAKKL